MVADLVATIHSKKLLCDRMERLILKHEHALDTCSRELLNRIVGNLDMESLQMIVDESQSLEDTPVNKLRDLGRDYNIRNFSRLCKSELILAILKRRSQ